VAALLRREPAKPRNRWLTFIAEKRLWILLALILLVEVFSPPTLSIALVAMLVWAGVELALFFARRRGLSSP
jgi:hypothetical protein